MKETIELKIFQFFIETKKIYLFILIFNIILLIYLQIHILQTQGLSIIESLKSIYNITPPIKILSLYTLIYTVFGIPAVLGLFHLVEDGFLIILMEYFKQIQKSINQHPELKEINFLEKFKELEKEYMKHKSLFAPKYFSYIGIIGLIFWLGYLLYLNFELLTQL